MNKPYSETTRNELQMTTSRAFGKTPAPDVPQGMTWLNAGRNLSLGDFRGRLLILHFWTYA